MGAGKALSKHRLLTHQLYFLLDEMPGLSRFDLCRPRLSILFVCYFHLPNDMWVFRVVLFLSTYIDENIPLVIHNCYLFINFEENGVTGKILEPVNKFSLNSRSQAQPRKKEKEPCIHLISFFFCHYWPTRIKTLQFSTHRNRFALETGRQRLWVAFRSVERCRHWLDVPACLCPRPNATLVFRAT